MCFALICSPSLFLFGRILAIDLSRCSAVQLFSMFCCFLSSMTCPFDVLFFLSFSLCFGQAQKCELCSTLAQLMVPVTSVSVVFCCLMKQPKSLKFDTVLEGRGIKWTTAELILLFFDAHQNNFLFASDQAGSSMLFK